MQRLIAALLLTLPASAVHATQVVDDFESGANPDLWGWGVSGGTFTIQTDGGNPGAWIDSGVPYYAEHPYLTALPAQGSALRAALASGTLTSARIDFEQLDTTGVSCFPRGSPLGPFTLEFFDLHSNPDGSIIAARTTNGPASPIAPFPWTTVSFPIPSASTDDVPPGWVLSRGDLTEYTWSTLMHNIDAISFYVGDASRPTTQRCWHLGADNVVITYGEPDDRIFADGFDTLPLR